MSDTTNLKVGAYKRRKQARFNVEHSEPVWYGDECDFLVIGTQYTASQAEDLFREFLEEQQAAGDWDYDIPSALDTLGNYDIGVGRDTDYDIGYSICFNDATEFSGPLWKAWSIQTS